MRISVQGSVPANGTLKTLLQGTQYQFAPETGMINFGCTASAVGVTLNINIGTDTVQEDSVVNANNRVPQTFEDDIATGVEIEAGEQVLPVFTNSTIAAITVFFSYEIEEDEDAFDVV